jgi:hypothetical protein
MSGVREHRLPVDHGDWIHFDPDDGGLYHESSASGRLTTTYWLGVLRHIRLRYPRKG